MIPFSLRILTHTLGLICINPIAPLSDFTENLKSDSIDIKETIYISGILYFLLESLIYLANDFAIFSYIFLFSFLINPLIFFSVIYGFIFISFVQGTINIFSFLLSIIGKSYDLPINTPNEKLMVHKTIVIPKIFR